MTPTILGSQQLTGCVLALNLTMATACADRFTLKSGGEIEGQLRAETDTHYQVRTFVGQIEIEKADVTRHEPSHSVFDDYDRRLTKLEQSADALVDLADWCGENGLSQERRQHLDQALKLNPNHALARAALGYTRVGEMWIESETVLETESQRERAAQQTERDTQRKREIKLNALKQSLKRIEIRYFLGRANNRDKSEQELEAFAKQDPLALNAMFEFLKDKPREVMRDALVHIFVATDEIKTIRYIAYAALKDPSEKIREFATDALVERDIVEVVRVLVAALDINSDIIKARAASLLAELDSHKAIPALIDNLVDRRRKWIQTASAGSQPYTSTYKIGTDRWSNNYLAYNPAEDGAGVNNRTWGWWGCPPSIAISHLPEHRLQYHAKRHRTDVPVYRTAVRDALRDLTGEDFGFDQKAWRDWHTQEDSTDSDVNASDDRHKDPES